MILAQGGAVGEFQDAFHAVLETKVSVGRGARCRDEIDFPRKVLQKQTVLGRFQPFLVARILDSGLICLTPGV